MSFRHMEINKLSYSWSTEVITYWATVVQPHFTDPSNRSTKSLAYTTLVRPILEYGAACWDPYREGQIYALDRVQKKAAKFAYDLSESKWETLSQRRKIAHICALFKAYSDERAWKFIGDRLQRPNYEQDWSWLENQEQEANDGYREIFLCE
jgi:hypothetical protein